MVFNSIFELLTVAADISQFASLKKTFDNHDQLQIMQRLDKIDDSLFNTLLKNQELIISLLGAIIMNKDLLNKITETQDKAKMDELGEIVIEAFNDLKHADRTKYNIIKYKLHKLAYGDHLSEEQAKHWVSKMKNKDGTLGEHWTYKQTEEVRYQYMPEANACDFYAALNMIYSDYYCTKFDDMDYITLTKDWLNDVDVGKDKTLKYYLFVVN